MEALISVRGRKPDVIDQRSWPGSTDVVSNKGDLVKIAIQKSVNATNSVCFDTVALKL